MPNRAVTLWVTWGSLRCGHLAVNTDREGPRPHLSSTQPRRVAQDPNPKTQLGGEGPLSLARLTTSRDETTRHGDDQGPTATDGSASPTLR